jgi:hypothetical protein
MAPKWFILIGVLNISSGMVRLVGGLDPSYGRLEIMNSNGIFHSVCEYNWNHDSDSQVVCRQLGYRWVSWLYLKDLGLAFIFSSIYFCIFTFATVSFYTTLWWAMHIYHLIDTYSGSSGVMDIVTCHLNVKVKNHVTTYKVNGSFLHAFLKINNVINQKCKYK